MIFSLLLELMRFNSLTSIILFIKKVLKEDYQLVCLDRPSLDFNALTKLKKKIININPSVIINAAAYTSVNKAESELKEAFLCNHKGPQFLSKLCFEDNILLRPLLQYDGPMDLQYIPLDQRN